MEVLIPITFLGVIGLISPRRWRRFLIYPSIATISLISIALSPPVVALANWALVFTLPADSQESVDAIVVLGRGQALRERRVEIVHKLWKSKRSLFVFASGMLDAHEITERLKEKGIPGASMGAETCSQTTEENARFTSALLRSRKVQKILLVTDSPHMLRASLAFRSFGFKVIPHVVSLPESWDSPKQMRVILREYAALTEYSVSNRFRPRNERELESPSIDVVQKIENWKCTNLSMASRKK